MEFAGALPEFGQAAGVHRIGFRPDLFTHRPIFHPRRVDEVDGRPRRLQGLGHEALIAPGGFQADVEGGGRHPVRREPRLQSATPRRRILDGAPGGPGRVVQDAF
jgi:hypothetical protein